MRIFIKFLILVFILIWAPGCSYLDRSDRLRSFKLEGEKGNVGINITDATRRLAIIYPNGRTCSELSPPAILEVDKTFKITADAGETSVGKISANIDTDKKTTAVKLVTSTEKVECLRIGLFHACALAAAEHLNRADEMELYKIVITTCYGESSN